MTDMMNLFLGKCNIECWNQCLGEPEGEDEFWTSHEKLSRVSSLQCLIKLYSVQVQRKEERVNIP